MYLLGNDNGIRTMIYFLFPINLKMFLIFFKNIVILMDYSRINYNLMLSAYVIINLKIFNTRRH